MTAYMETTFGHAETAHIFSTADPSETDTLIDLFFSPDRCLRMNFENRWGETCFQEEDLAEIESILSSNPLMAQVIDADGAPLLKLKAPDFALHALVRRLKPTWQPVLALAQALRERVSDDRRLSLRAALRTTELGWHEGQVSAAVLFLNHMPPEAEDYDESFSFLLYIIGELRESVSLFEFLTSRKAQYTQHLNRAEAFERRLRSGSMEILMSQGDRSAYGDPISWRWKIERIDRLCRVLFGHSEYINSNIVHQFELSSSEAGPDLDAISRFLA
jgi:hypothetical protein